MAVQSLLPTILVTVAWYLSISTCTYRLAAMGGHPRPWRAFLPVENIAMLCSIAGKRQSRWMVVLLLGVPVVGAVMFATLGGALMEKTGRSRFTGYVLATPPVALLGLPLIAYSARKLQPVTVRS